MISNENKAIVARMLSLVGQTVPEEKTDDRGTDKNKLHRVEAYDHLQKCIAKHNLNDANKFSTSATDSSAPTFRDRILKLANGNPANLKQYYFADDLRVIPKSALCISG